MRVLAETIDGRVATATLIPFPRLPLSPPSASTDGPFQRWPLLATFHPNDGSFAHSSLGWVGLYGTLTGYSSSNLAVSEKVWDAYKGLDNIFGYPWTLMLQDIMRFDADIDEALARIGGAVRTCSIWVGLGQGARPNPLDNTTTIPADFKLLGDSFEELHIYNPNNFVRRTQTNKPGSR